MTARLHDPSLDPIETAPRISFVVVTHQSEDCIEECLRSIHSQRPRPSQVTVVDSGSRDGTATRVARFASVRWLPMGRNIGFAAAANRGVATASGDLVAVLNADVSLHPGWVSAMLRSADRYPTCGSFGSVQFRSAGDGLDGAGDCLHCSGLVWRRGKGDATRPREDLETFSACGAAAVYRRDAFLRCGGFEESFFCYFEDVDLGFRLRLRGHGCVTVAAASCEHRHGHSAGGPQSEFETYHGHRNMVWSYLRCMPEPLLWLLVPAFIASQLACLAATSLRGQGRLALRAKLDALSELRRVLRERRSIQRSRLASAAAIANALAWAIVPRRRDSRGRSAVRLAAMVERD